MELDALIAQMAHSAQVIRAMVEHVTDQQARWKPAPDAWSILEVIHHLYDEEREDFRVRLDYILHRPDQPWPGIDPQGWVQQRHYNQQDFLAALEGFWAARQDSLDWLRGLGRPEWKASCELPWGFRIAAGDMFAAWVAHDLLHTRQLVELQWAYTTLQVRPYDVRYAGEW